MEIWELAIDSDQMTAQQKAYVTNILCTSKRQNIQKLYIIIPGIGASMTLVYSFDP